MTNFLYIPPVGKNKILSRLICDGSDLEFTVRDGVVEKRKSGDQDEANKLYCEKYPQFCEL
jgi:hypothetical protein